jgi:formylglycine-generating enzyme required for sulfatase activity
MKGALKYVDLDSNKTHFMPPQCIWHFDGSTSKEQMVFNYCPAGSFIMGSPGMEVGRSNDENQVKVNFSRGFYLGQKPVSQVQWQTVMGINPSRFLGNDLPVHNIEWEDAATYVLKMNHSIRSEMNGWEFAAALRAKYQQKVPIIVMTAASDAQKRAKDVYAAECIPKPFELDVLLEMIKKQIG